jgi:hypothetical protein
MRISSNELLINTSNLRRKRLHLLLQAEADEQIFLKKSSWVKSVSKINKNNSFSDEFSRKI